MADPKTIHVIDDDTALRTAYAAALNRLGYHTQTAADGLKGEALLAAGQPDLVLLDMLMPHLDGVGFLKGLRADPANAGVKVVVVSNFESMPESEALGVDKY
ncbi:MAG TPA: response regulator, partial [Candidatus Saccharimonadales bacterium]|nr:response regulator [Candidatus Saccharimonadales bacterium]